MRFFTSVQDDTYTNNVILSEAKNLNTILLPYGNYFTNTFLPP